MFHSDFQLSVNKMPPSILKQAVYRAHRKTGVPISELCLISHGHLFHAKIVESAIEYSARNYRKQRALALRRKAKARIDLLDSIAAVKGMIDRNRQATPPPVIASPTRHQAPRDIRAPPPVPKVAVPLVHSQRSSHPSPSPEHRNYRTDIHRFYTSSDGRESRRTVDSTYYRAADRVVPPPGAPHSKYATPSAHSHT